MKEILFRGKDKYSERWYEGFILNKNKDKIGYYNNCMSFNILEIKPETVGQFTGLTDKNGKKIFEGDIVKWDEKEWGSPYNEIVNFDYELLTMRESDYPQWVEVIGNIHDKELLGE